MATIKQVEGKYLAWLADDKLIESKALEFCGMSRPKEGKVRQLVASRCSWRGGLWAQPLLGER